MIQSWGARGGELRASDLEKLIEAHPDWNTELSGMPYKSLRARHKIMRLALTFAAWDGVTLPRSDHFMEAACYRPERFGLCD